MVRNKKKGSLSLSINAIVVFVLALTLLGLGLPFITNMINRARGLTDDRFDSILNAEEEQFLDDCTDEFCLKATTIDLETTSEEDAMIVVNNKFDCSINDIQISVGDQPGGSDKFQMNACDMIVKEDSKCSDIQIQTVKSISLDPKSKDKRFIVVTVKNTAKPTFYTYPVRVTGSCDYQGNLFEFDEQKSLTIKVTG